MPDRKGGKKLVRTLYGQSREDAVDNILMLEDSPLPDVTKLQPHDVLVGVCSFEESPPQAATAILNRSTSKMAHAECKGCSRLLYCLTINYRKVSYNPWRSQLNPPVRFINTERARAV